jgi:hypothetical protein
MRKVSRSMVVDFQSYGDKREAFRRSILAEKEKRRIHVGEFLTFLFETTNTILYQVQEMMRLEQMVREADIQHEIDTYNALIGDTGELSCTLLIEIDDQKDRNEKLVAWLGLPAHLYVRTYEGDKIRAIWDPAQIGDTRLSSVQYLKFPVGSKKPVAIGSDLPALRIETELSEEQRATLLHDLTS